MVVESSDDNATTNKGVNVNSESLPVRVHHYSETENSSAMSIADIKNEIQNALDLMGPNTPQTTCNTSSEADNEDSLMSLPKSAHAKKRSLSLSERGKSPKSSSENKTNRTEEDAQCSLFSSGANKDSLVADVGNFSACNDESEHSCCDRTHCHAGPECLCMMYMNQNCMHAPPPRPCDGCYPATNKSTRTTNVECKKRGLVEWLKERSSELILKKPANLNPCELYKLNLCGQEQDGGLPKKVVFDLIGGIPKPTSCTVATNTAGKPVENTKTGLQNSSNCTCKEYKNITNETITQQKSGAATQKRIYFDSEGNTRVDYYYFDHGNSQFFRTTDAPPVMKCEILAEKTERYTTRFWAEFFASIHIAVSFCVSFILQLFKFLLYSVIRPLCVGLMQMGSDYFFKPCLTTCFNGLIQPLLIFLYNIATSLRDLCDPIAEAVGYFWKELSVLLRAIRLCTYKKNTHEDSCDCNKIRKCEC